MDRFASLAPDPEQQASNSEARRLLEEAVEKLPNANGTIFMLRDVEDMARLMPRRSSKSPRTMSKSASIERERCCARVFTHVLEWKGNKHSTFMPCDAIECEESI